MRRVVLKSPVLENCTPGSVRGALGNQRPYLDNFARLRFQDRGPAKLSDSVMRRKGTPSILLRICEYLTFEVHF